MNTFNITADLVTKNQIVGPKDEVVIVNDVFDIPDVMATAPVNVPFPAPIAPAPAQIIKNINHTTMTDVMNQTILRNTHKEHPTAPSVSTRHSDVSVPGAVPVLGAVPVPGAVPGRAVTPALPVLTPALVLPALTTTTTPHPPTAHESNTNKIVVKHRSTMSKNTKIIVEEEDKDTAIDYDDDDPEIKKTKLSLFHFAKDITFNLIFIIPFLRTKLTNLLRDPSLAINQIERVFDEFKDRLNRQQLESLKKYVCEDGIRDKLNYILETGFNKILSDGKIDINDAPQFNQLVYFIIRSFNNINQGKVYRFYVSSEHVMLLLHFILKSVFTLTLKGDEEQMAIGLLDTSFKLVQIEVLPLISKRWYHRFRICHAVKEIEELIE